MKVNWYEARRWYIYGGDSPAAIGKRNRATGSIHLPSYEEIANYYGSNLQTFKRRPTKEKWVEIRAFTQNEIAKKASERLMELQIDDLVTETKEAYVRFKSTLRLYDEQIRDKKTKVFPADAVKTQEALLNIVKQASGVDGDEDKDAYKEFMKKVIKGE